MQPGPPPSITSAAERSPQSCLIENYGVFSVLARRAAPIRFCRSPHQKLHNAERAHPTSLKRPGCRVEGDVAICCAIATTPLCKVPFRLVPFARRTMAPVEPLNYRGPYEGTTLPPLTNEVIIQ